MSGEAVPIVPAPVVPAPVVPAAQPKWVEEDYDFVAACWDDVRRCLLYDCYFGHQVTRIRRANLATEIIVAVTASGSAIAGWTFWTTAVGGLLWAGLGG